MRLSTGVGVGRVCVCGCRVGSSSCQDKALTPPPSVKLVKAADEQGKRRGSAEIEPEKEESKGRRKQKVVVGGNDIYILCLHARER